MCGICGIVQFDGKAVEQEVLQGMTSVLAHRGPDGEGVYTNAATRRLSGPSVGLGHRRLAIIDLSVNAAQPMTNPDRSLWVVFNGEIYNFKQLQRQLQTRGYSFRSGSDTEVILHLYEDLGEKCVEELDGMFAFALWDERRQRLLLARDRAGKKPLYYANTGTAFVFGSEVKALLRHPTVAGAISLDALPHYFTFGYPPQGQSFYQGVAQLEPATVMTVAADGRIERRRYWDLTFSRRADRRPSKAEACEQVRALVTEAVRKRLVADVPLGAFLSGGIDSSIVVGLMSRMMDGPVKTFSLGFSGDPDFDETCYAQIVARHFRTDHTEFMVEPKAIDLIESLVWHHDGPFGDSSAIPTSIVSQLTREHVTVALNGDGGDELFAGYLRFQACLAAESLPLGLLRLGKALTGAFPEPKRYHHWLRRGQRFFQQAAHPLLDRLRGWVAIFEGDLSKLLRPEVVGKLDAGGMGFPPRVLAGGAGLSPLGRILYVNFMTYLPDDLLVKMDRCAMAHSLEARSPFLDYRLAEYAAQLPDDYKLRLGTTKYILKEAFADLLPAEILHRGKKGFGVPLEAWFRTDLRDYIQDMLLNPAALSYEYLQPAYVAMLVREHLDGARNHGLRLWALLTFEVWLQLMRWKALHKE